MESVEKIIVRNFCGIDNVEINFSKYLILIGPQSSGKSVISKLIWWARTTISSIYFEVQGGHTYRDIVRHSKEMFDEVFHSDVPDDLYIKYESGGLSIEITSTSRNKLKIKFCEKLCETILDFVKYYRIKLQEVESDGPKSTSLIRRDLRKQFNKIIEQYSGESTLVRSAIYAPAARSFFSQVEDSLFTYLSNSRRLDPVVEDFGSYLKWVKDNHQKSKKFEAQNEYLEKLYKDLLKGRYVRSQNEELIEHPDGRTVPIAAASSGQQEIMPLCLILNDIAHSPSTPRLFIIEEPEAHLHPAAQKTIIEAIVHAAELSNGKVIVTTHSPYVLSVVNNLYLAGKVKNNDQDVGENVIESTTLQFGSTIGQKKLSAYCLCNGGAFDLIDADVDLINAEIIDDVSIMLSQDFDKLLQELD